MDGKKLVLYCALCVGCAVSLRLAEGFIRLDVASITGILWCLSRTCRNHEVGVSLRFASFKFLCTVCVLLCVAVMSCAALCCIVWHIRQCVVLHCFAYTSVWEDKMVATHATFTTLWERKSQQ